MRKHYQLRLPAETLDLGKKTVLMGVVNVTPDSFADGGHFIDPDRAVEHALRLEAEGASIIDIGGESTRPGSDGVRVEVEWNRVGPVLDRLKGKLRAAISIDTTKYEVAERALDLGAAIINDVSGLRFEPRLADLAAARHAALVIVHMRHTPATMQQMPFSQDILSEAEDFFRSAVGFAMTRGVQRDQIVIDPGIGFGKRVEQNLQLINHLDRFMALDLPIMVGASRKAFIGKIVDCEPSERLYGSVGASLIAALRGAHIVRVHDVKPTSDAIRLAEAILRS